MPSSKKQAKRERKIQAHTLRRVLPDFDESLKCRVDISILNETNEVATCKNGTEHRLPFAFKGGGANFMRTMYKLSIISDKDLHFANMKFWIGDMIDICGANTLQGANGLAAIHHYRKTLLDSSRSEDEVLEQMHVHFGLVNVEMYDRLDREWESKLSQHPCAHHFFVPGKTVHNLLRGANVGWIPDTLEAWSPLQRGMRRLKGEYGQVPIQLMKLITWCDIEMTLLTLLRNAAAHVDAMLSFVRLSRADEFQSAQRALKLIKKLITHRRGLNLQLFDLEARLNVIDGRLQLTSQMQEFETFEWTLKTNLLRGTQTKYIGMQEGVLSMKAELKRMTDKYFEDGSGYSALLLFAVGTADTGRNDVRVDALSVYGRKCCRCQRWDCPIFSALQDGREVYDDVDENMQAAAALRHAESPWRN